MCEQTSTLGCCISLLALAIFMNMSMSMQQWLTHKAVFQVMFCSDSTSLNVHEGLANVKARWKSEERARESNRNRPTHVFLVCGKMLQGRTGSTQVDPDRLRTVSRLQLRILSAS